MNPYIKLISPCIKSLHFGQHAQLNYALNIYSRVNIKHRRVELSILNYKVAKSRLGKPLSGCFLNRCKFNGFWLTCNNCILHYDISEL